MAAVARLLQRALEVDGPGWPPSESGQVVAFYLFDVAETIDLQSIPALVGGAAVAARLFGLVADRLGLDTWKAKIQEKLDTLNDIYRFAVEQISMSRGQFLELTVVLILVLELVLLLLGVMK